MAVLHVEARGLMYVTCGVQFGGMGHGPPDTWEARIGGAEDERGTSTGMRSRETRTRTKGTQGRRPQERSSDSAERTKSTGPREDARGGGGGEEENTREKKGMTVGGKHSVGTGREGRRDEARSGKEGREGTILSGAGRRGERDTELDNEGEPREET